MHIALCLLETRFTSVCNTLTTRCDKSAVFIRAILSAALSAEWTLPLLLYSGYIQALYSMPPMLAYPRNFIWQCLRHSQPSSGSTLLIAIFCSYDLFWKCTHTTTFPCDHSSMFALLSSELSPVRFLPELFSYMCIWQHVCYQNMNSLTTQFIWWLLKGHEWSCDVSSQAVWPTRCNCLVVIR